MNIPRRKALLLSPGWAVAALGALLFFALLFARNLNEIREMQNSQKGAAGEGTYGSDERIDTPVFDAVLGEVLRPAAIVPRLPSGQLARRFRLVGSMADGVGESAVWTVILEDVETNRQLRAKPGDELLPDSHVVKTGPDFAKVEAPDGVHWIVRDRAKALETRFVVPGESDPDKRDAEGRDAFGGRKVEENRWEFSRGMLMDYYADLLRNPERLVAVFDSMEPLYDDRQKIEGYQLNVLGEAAFFESVGFVQGDIVRAVNGVQMTNRRRAENFIRRVVEEGLDTVVIEIERDGTPLKNIYQTVP